MHRLCLGGMKCVLSIATNRCGGLNFILKTVADHPQTGTLKSLSFPSPLFFYVSYFSFFKKILGPNNQPFRVLVQFL
jgi:hypothetical protein